jgi:hypothetical protein
MALAVVDAQAQHLSTESFCLQKAERGVETATVEHHDLLVFFHDLVMTVALIDS